MKPYLSIGLAGLIWGTFVCLTSADDPRPQTPTDEFRALLTKYQHAQEEYKKAYREAKTYSERRKLEQERRKLEEEALPLTNEQKYAGDVVRLMEKYPKDPGVIDAYLWLLAHWPIDPEFTKAAHIITENQIESEHMATICRWLADHESSVSISFLWQLVKGNQHHEVRGLARYGLAHQLKLRSEIAVDPYVETLIRSLGNSADGDSAKETTATAENLLEEVVANYGQITIGTSTLEKIAASELVEIRQLSVGKTAPEIEGKDLNGKPMKLTDFRGKLVLLIFWDSTTVNDFGPIRAVARRFKEKPFVILGVNGDKDRRHIEDAIELQEITWPSWADGVLSGPIGSRWNVKNRPKMYLIDKKGVIRFKGADLEGFTLGYDYDGSFRQNYRLEEAVKQVLWNIPE